MLLAGAEAPRVRGPGLAALGFEKPYGWVPWFCFQAPLFGGVPSAFQTDETLLGAASKNCSLECSGRISQEREAFCYQLVSQSCSLVLGVPDEGVPESLSGAKRWQK